MVGKLLGLAAHLGLFLLCLQTRRNGDKALPGARLERAAARQRVGLIAHPTPGNGLPVQAVALVVVHRCNGRIDRDFMKVRPAQAGYLGVDIGMNAPSQQRVIREINTRHHMRGAKGHLLGLGKEVVRIAVQHHAAHRLDRDQFFRNNLGRVQDVKAELLCLFLGEDLHAQLVFRVGTCLDPLPQVAPVVVRVGTGNLDRLVPHLRMRAGHRVPVKLDKHRFSGVVDKAKAVHAEALHRGVAARKRAVRHLPHQHVGGLGHQ